MSAAINSILERRATKPRSAIPVLFRTASPSAVRGFVVSFTPPAVDHHSLWPAPHVSKEILEFVPSLAYFYATASIAVITDIVLVLAAFDHRAPRIVFGCPPTFSGMAVSVVALTATTTCRTSVPKTSRLDAACRATIAPALPSRAALSAEHRKMAKHDTAKIKAFTHA